MTLGKPGEADWIQTDASIDQGNSGGPLLDDAGIVYGLNTFFLKNVANAYFENTAPAIRHAMQSRKAVRDLASLPGRHPSLPVPHGGDPRDPSPPMIALPDAIVKDIEKRVAAGEFAPVVKTMIEHREKALLNAKIILANKARDLQKTLADVETGKTSIIQMATNDLLTTAGGADFALYLLLIREIDEKIERQGNVEATAQKLAAMLTGSGDALTKVTAACALHRIHVRDSPNSWPFSVKANRTTRPKPSWLGISSTILGRFLHCRRWYCRIFKLSKIEIAICAEHRKTCWPGR